LDAPVVALEPSVRMWTGQRRALSVRVHNNEQRAWSSEADPPIRASCRWLTAAGVPVVTDGPRTPLPHSLAPGESAGLGLDVAAPVLPGRYRLQLAMVEEGVRWLEPASDVTVEVRGPPLAAVRRRLWRLGPPPGAGGPIPRVLHRVWLGERPLPDAARKFGEGWRHHHPGWQMRLWGDGEARRLLPARVLRRCRSASERSNLVRYEVLRRHGGVYVDTDVECRRPLDALLEGVEAFAGWAVPHRIETAVLGAVPGHPTFALAAREARLTVGLSFDSVEANGPGLLTLVCAERPLPTLFGPATLYPYRWDERGRRDDPFPEAYAVHHWDLSWKDPAG
jgi:hypothetical protein